MAESMTGSASQPWNLMPPRFRSILLQPAFHTSQPHSTAMTMYTAGPAQSMNLRMASMPCQNTKACNTHMTMKATQPSADRPTKPCCDTSAYGARLGNMCSASTMKAAEARYVCTPYQATAISPRMIAGMLAPSTPKDARHTTG